MSLLNMSFSASILILVIVIIRALLLHKLPKRTFLVLWGAVLCRLLIPFEISSRFSIYSMVNALTDKTALPIDNELLKLWQQEHPMRRSVQIYQSDRIAAPLTYGIFRPIVLLPKQTDWTDETRKNSKY